MGKVPIRKPNKNLLVDPPSPAYKLKYYEHAPTYSRGTGPGWYWVDGWVTIWALKEKKK